MPDPRWQAIARRLAETNPETFDAQTMRYHCFFCAVVDLREHDPDCVWQQAQDLIKEWDYV